ncbi:Phosphatidylinositol 4-kinase type 2-beta [Paramicrosporidium saccamoebae]|uniref:Phosphatidylinositol 4-kinase n=1 Tax=Paramicrosporidium saccamoebae TaxID=1246581 RepID=A0A2H9TJV9_9FUNG|nr:Phosphatidylinositol 4-kinase type 2-beta [Paramicrosporidium saccamoebae]
MLPLRSALTCVEGFQRPRKPLALRPYDRLEMESASHTSLSITSIDMSVAGKTPPRKVDIPTTKSQDELEDVELDARLEVEGDGEREMMREMRREMRREMKREETDVMPEHAPLALRSKMTNGFIFNWINTNQEFLRVVEGCQRAIDRNTYPLRIGQGSSGSYFVRDESEKIVGVFKPKDEEPYGHLNPKWIKWLHRTCCPCLFGRSFLVPNIGYISEAAASMVDSFLGLNMVPRTQIARLRSSAFVFPWWEHVRIWRERHENPVSRYPHKLGSFQLFVEGFEDSSTVISKLNELRPLEPELRTAFQAEFEKMTILDYAIRNTDRSLDNWLIHLSWTENPNVSTQARHPLSASAAQSTAELHQTHKTESAPDLLRPKTPRLLPCVKIACIDNGLAFPFKHPHEVRSYPYSWVHLPEAQTPYSLELRTSLLEKLADTASWDLLISQLRQIFEIDSDFNERIFKKQMAILRGQLYNIVQALREGESPARLVERPLMLIEEEDEPELSEEGFEAAHTRTAPRKRHRHTPVTEKPLLTCW